MTPQELLAANGIYLESYAPGRHYTTCRKCSRNRSKAHQGNKVLGITIEDDGGVHFGCNHCGWTGPEKGTGKSNGQGDGFTATYDYCDADGILRFQKVRNPPGSKTRFFMRRPDGHGGWINNTKGVDTNLLYRIDEVNEAIALGQRIAVVEGEKDANSLWSINIPATCNAQGASEPGKKPKWKPEHSAQLAGAPIVVIPDHDDAGSAHADATCRCSFGVAERVCRLDLAKHWPECPKGGDVSDWLDAGHTREELDALFEKAPVWEYKDKDARFKLVRFNNITLQTAPAYLVAGLIPRIGLIVIWGPMKCGKSFWVFDLLMHVARDRPYRGRKVRQGEVVYLALEGHAGLNRRVEAYRKHHGVTDAPFYLITDRTDLVKDHTALIAAIRAQSVNPAAVAIDTLNRSIFGSESKDEDMSAYIKAADAVREAFNCAVIIIHHCGIDERRPRGHTSLGGAVDAQLAVTRDAAQNVVVEVEWMKDGDSEGNVIISRLERVEVGKDDDGNVLSSCVVEPVEDGATPKPERKTKLSPKDELARRALVDLAADQGKPPPATWGLPNGVQVVPTETWRTTLLSRDIVEDDRRRFWDLKNRLKVKNAIAERDQLVWLATSTMKPTTTTNRARTP